MLSDPDYSSSSEQSCDTVIYVGPGGAAISDRELSDNEGPPAFVPIIPSLNKKRSTKDGPLDRDQFFKCNTFAELQERLECIDGSEEPTVFVGEGKKSQASPKIEKSKESQGSVSPKTLANISYNQDGVSPKQSPKSVVIAPSCSPNSKSKLDNTKMQCISEEMAPSESVCRTSADGEKTLVSESPNKAVTSAGPNSEPVVREKVYFNKKALPKPAPPSSQQKENTDKEERSCTRMPPVGMSHQAVKRRDPYSSPLLRAPVEVCQVRSTLRERCLDRDILRATVTLQQPVELNGEDELVFTVVEELSIGSIVDKGRPSSIISFNSDCSLQALASGSRPVSIISSINDEFDAYTSAVGGSEVNIAVVTPLQEGAMDSRGSSISSWLSEVSVCTMESEGVHSTDVFLPQSKHTAPEATFYFDSLDMLHCVSSPRDTKNSLNDSGFSFSELDSDSAASSKLSLTKCPPSPESAKSSLKMTSKMTKAHSLSSSQLPQGPSMVHSSLPRKIKPTSSISHSSSSSSSGREPPRQEAKQDDPWQRSNNQPEPQLSDSSSTSKFLRNPPSSIPSCRTSNHSNSVPRPPKVQGSTSSQRVVDGCEKSAIKNPPSKMPQLRRGATTLGTVPVIHSSADHKGTQDVTASPTSLKYSSLGKNNKANSQKASNLPRPGCTSPPPPPPVRKSSLDHKTKTLLPQSALKSAYGEAGRGTRAAVSEDELEVRHRVDSTSYKTSSLNTAKVTSSLKGRGPRGEYGQHYGSQMSLEKCESLSLSGSRAALSRENSGTSLGSSKSNKSIPRFGIPNSSSSPIATCPSSPSGGSLSRSGQAKAAAGPRALGAANGSKARSLSANNSKGLSSSTKSLAAPVTRNTNANLPPSGRTSATRTATAAVSSKPGRGTIMGTKQAMRAANSRVSELATGSISGKHMRGSGDSDSGNDSGVNVGDDKSPVAMLPSPYSKITAPRRPQRYSSGHGSDNSSVLSGELPPAMGRTALFYHSGGSSGYESMIRDSEATGSASSAHDSMSESGMSTSGRMRSSKYPKKRANGEEMVLVLRFYVYRANTHI